MQAHTTMGIVFGQRIFFYSGAKLSKSKELRELIFRCTLLDRAGSDAWHFYPSGSQHQYRDIIAGNELTTRCVAKFPYTSLNKLICIRFELAEGRRSTSSRGIIREQQRQPSQR